MKKVLLTLLAIIVVAGVLGGAGFAGYRFGYRQGISTNVTSDSIRGMRPFGPANGFGQDDMPMHNFNNKGVAPRFHQGMFLRGNGMPFGRGIGFFAPIFFILRIAFWVLIIWIAYKLLTSWRVSFTRVDNQNLVETQPKNIQEEKSE